MSSIKINQQEVAAMGMGSWHLGEGLQSESSEINALRSACGYLGQSPTLRRSNHVVLYGAAGDKPCLSTNKLL